MVCLDLHFVNRTGYDFVIKNRNDSARIYEGGSGVQADTETIIKLRPESGFLGIECGIQGSLSLYNPDVSVQVNYDFPAVGDDNYAGLPSDMDKVKVHAADNGKYGKDNPHHVIFTMTPNGVSSLVATGYQPQLAPLTPIQSSNTRDVLLYSGRFNDPDAEMLIRTTHAEAPDDTQPFVVQAGSGERFGRMTMEGLDRAYAMVAFVTGAPHYSLSPYGQKTTSAFSTFWELKYWLDHQDDMGLIVVQLCDPFPPETGEAEGTRQMKFAFSPDLVRIDGIGKSPEELAVEIAVAARHLHKRYSR